VLPLTPARRCFYVGNDFLPPLPSMDIREGAIDLLMGLYKVVLPGLGGYLTSAGTVNLSRVDGLLERVGVVEDEIFRRRRVKEERDKRRDEQQAAEAAAAKQRARARLEAQASVSAADVLELAVMSSTGGSSSKPPRQEDASLAVRRVLEASVASVEAERAAAGVVPAVIHQAITAGLGVRVAVVRPGPQAAVSYSGAAVAPRVKGDVTGTVSDGKGAATAPSSKGMTEEVNRSAAAALRAGLLRGGASPAAPAVAPGHETGFPSASSAAVHEAESSGVEPLAGLKRRRGDEEEMHDKGGAPPAPLLSAVDTEPVSEPSLAAAAAAVPAAAVDSVDIALAPDLIPGLDDVDIFAAPLDADELALLQPPPAAVDPSVPAPVVIAPKDAASLIDVIPKVEAAAPGPPSEPLTPLDSAASTPSAANSDAAAAAVDDGVEDEEEEEPPIDPSLAPGIGDMLRGAVLKTMQAKRTHAGAEDNVRFGATGWKDRYYCAKFGPALGSDPRFRDALRRHYTEGLCWVFRYYYFGVASWTWFFPYHYAPFASDLTKLATVPVKFELGAPFPPIAQLMGVLPPRSAHALPAAVQKLMTEPTSTIADFYPTRFDMDPNGKRFTWQWVVLLPFIDETRLMAALGTVEDTFTAEEIRRNRTGTDMLFVHMSTPLGEKLKPLVEVASAAVPSAAASVPGAGVAVVSASPGTDAPAAAVVTLRPDFDATSQKCLSGAAMSLAEGGADKRGLTAPRLGQPYPAPWRGGDAVAAVQSVTVLFLAPARRPHRCLLLPGALPPPRVLSDAEDDPSGRIPRLTRGMTVADLVQTAAAGGGGRGGLPQLQGPAQYGAPRPFGGGGGGGASGYTQHQQQSPYSQSATSYGPPPGMLRYQQPPSQLPQQQQYYPQQQQYAPYGGRQVDLGPAQRMIRSSVGVPGAPTPSQSLPPTPYPSPYGSYGGYYGAAPIGGGVPRGLQYGGAGYPQAPPSGSGAYLAGAPVAVPISQAPQQRFSFMPGGGGVAVPRPPATHGPAPYGTALQQQAAGAYARPQALGLPLPYGPLRGGGAPGGSAGYYPPMFGR
jgi:hypothetical protein